jgi:biotin carboxyl carrier protein
MAVIDTGVLMHQVPGGMISNLVAQLREAKALDRIDEVYAELPKVRKELGYPPLVTPTSQIVGIQAVQNVLFGRYKVISTQVKDYVYGLYGRPPAKVDSEVQKMVLKGYERGETPITDRPGDILEPEMDKAFAESKDIAKDIGDVLIYALYLLKWKYGQETPPPETKAKTLEDIKREDELIAKAKAGALTEAATTADVSPAPTKEITPAAKAAEIKKDETPITAPMPGLIIRYDVKVGDKVKAGDNVVVLEAMKMAIDLAAPVDGQVRAVFFKAGDHVARDNVLVTIS